MATAPFRDSADEKADSDRGRSPRRARGHHDRERRRHGRRPARRRQAVRRLGGVEVRPGRRPHREQGRRGTCVRVADGAGAERPDVEGSGQARDATATSARSTCRTRTSRPRARTSTPASRRWRSRSTGWRRSWPRPASSAEVVRAENALTAASGAAREPAGPAQGTHRPGRALDAARRAHPEGLGLHGLARRVPGRADEGLERPGRHRQRHRLAGRCASALARGRRRRLGHLVGHPPKASRRASLQLEVDARDRRPRAPPRLRHRPGPVPRREGGSGP